MSLCPTQALRGQQGAPPAAAPRYGANATRYGIAVVDISFVFKNYPKFLSSIEVLKKEMEAKDGELKQDRDRIIGLEQARDALKPGSPDFKKADEDLARLKADFSIRQGTVRRDFLEKEAAIYYQTYMDISKTVSEYAMNHNIGLVLRFNGDPIDRSQREDVMRAITSPIVFENNVDITPEICTLLGIQLPRAAGTAQLPGGTIPK
jgi:hypothetical protein